MNKEKLLNVIEGIVLVVLGIMVAINGWGAMDTYFGFHINRKYSYQLLP